ncbi:hypothetical protein JYT44_01915 [Caldithrix abyssi]|nr:hypothetical protein [Caldithrix abyssi]
MDKTKLQSRATNKQLEARKNLVDLFQNSPIPVEELLVNLPLYMRSSTVAKFLYINELYQHIINTPGVIMEFGVWWGANLAIFESLRAVYEPYNYTRKAIGFDTFDGYASISSSDGEGELILDGNYNVADNYRDYLTRVLDYHQEENIMSHVSKYELVKGNASKTLREYLDKHPETIISLAYFDMQLYEPTKNCLKMILPHLVKGSVIAMDELNSWEFPGETIAFKEVIGLARYRIVRSNFLPDRSYLVIE